MANDENFSVQVAPHAPSSPLPFDSAASPSLPNSLSKSPVFKSLNQGARGCVTCGHGADGRLLHRLKHDGAVRHHCSSCILFYNKGMYCSQCFQVYRDTNQLGDPALWLTCSQCLRLSHLGCVRKRVSPSFDRLDLSFFTCPDCRDSSSRAVRLHSTTSAEDLETPCNTSPHRHLLPVDGLEQKSDLADFALVRGDVAVSTSSESSRSAFQELSVQDQEALAAANIVAALAANEAKEAKTRARATAGAAVKAAARAKAALDAAYRAAREEAKWNAAASRNFPITDGQRITQPTGATQSAGAATVSEKRMLETVFGNSDHVDQLTRTTSSQEELERSLKNASNAPRSPRSGVAIYRRRSLSATAASEANSFAPTQVVTNQVQDGLGNGLNAGLRVLTDRLGVSASPASILESSNLLGTPRSDAVASVSDTDNGGKPCRSPLLPGNDSLGNSRVPSFVDGLTVAGSGVATDGCTLLPRLIPGNSVTSNVGVDGKSANQPDIEELGGFAPDPNESVTDDLVDLETLLPREHDENEKFALESEKNNSATLPKPKTDVVVGAITPTVVTLCSEQPIGTKLTGEQG